MRTYTLIRNTRHSLETVEHIPNRGKTKRSTQHTQEYMIIWSTRSTTPISHIGIQMLTCHLAKRNFSLFCPLTTNIDHPLIPVDIREEQPASLGQPNTS